MAFLDNIFNPSNYSDTISRLLGYPQPQLGASSAGFPDSYGSYGGVNYPVYGRPEDQTTTLSAQAQQAPQQQQPAMPAPDFRQGLREKLQMAAGIINPSLANSIAQMRQGDQAQASYGALVASGVPDAIARAAALNPEILKTIAPAYFDTAPKLQETGTNPFTGQKTFGLYKPNTQTLTEAPIRAANGQAPQRGTLDMAMQSDVRGEPFLEAVKSDPNYGQQEVNIIKKMVSGD